MKFEQHVHELRTKLIEMAEVCETLRIVTNRDTYPAARVLEIGGNYIAVNLEGYDDPYTERIINFTAIESVTDGETELR